MHNSTPRIWELDFARGLALIGMIIIHFLYDLVDLFGILPWDQPQWYLLFKNNYGAVFLVISGISATLGTHCVRRGLQVFCCGFLVTAATLALYFAGVSDRSILIFFGVLHCLGVCMILWALLRKLPGWALVLSGLALCAAGLYLRCIRIDGSWLLMPVGFPPARFASSDYFPLLPNLGYFLLGAAAGRRLYPERATRFPAVSHQKQPVRALCRMGENSLLVYLIHQPVLVLLALALQFAISHLSILIPV